MKKFFSIFSIIMLAFLATPSFSYASDYSMERYIEMEGSQKNVSDLTKAEAMAIASRVEVKEDICIVIIETSDLIIIAVFDC